MKHSISRIVADISQNCNCIYVYCLNGNNSTEIDFMKGGRLEILTENKETNIGAGTQGGFVLALPLNLCKPSTA